MRLLLVGGGPAGATAAMQARSWAPTPRCVKPSRSGNKPEQRTGAGPTLPRARPGLVLELLGPLE